MQIAVSKTRIFRESGIILHFCKSLMSGTKTSGFLYLLSFQSATVLLWKTPMCMPLLINVHASSYSFESNFDLTDFPIVCGTSGGPHTML